MFSATGCSILTNRNGWKTEIAIIYQFRRLEVRIKSSNCATRDGIEMARVHVHTVIALLHRTNNNAVKNWPAKFVHVQIDDDVRFIRSKLRSRAPIYFVPTFGRPDEWYAESKNLFGDASKVGMNTGKKK